MSHRPHVVIAGGGLAGCLVALALAEHRPDVRFLLLEQGQHFGGRHIWSFFDTDLDEARRALVEPLISRSWSSHEIAFPQRHRVLSTPYNSIRSEALDAEVRARLSPDRYRLGCDITEVERDHVILAGGEKLDADVVLDARGPVEMPGVELGWQKFVGRTYRLSGDHGVTRPMIMDARVPQCDGYRFIYLLPFASDELMIEDTYYSGRPDLDTNRLGEGLDGIAARFGAAEVRDQEAGVLPVVIEGEVETLWRSARAPLLGIRGGFFHPTTGYSLPDAAGNALFIAGRTSFAASDIFTALKSRAQKLWRDRHFFQLLNRMLFRAAVPEERYRVLEHFYRLPESTISRFYAADLTTFDKLRILSGKPPVPVRRALRAAQRQAA